MFLVFRLKGFKYFFPHVSDVWVKLGVFGKQGN